MTNEHKRSLSLLKILARNVNVFRPVEDLGLLLAPPHRIYPKESFHTLSPIQIAEQMTYLDHQIFRAIRSEELLNQSWMKPDKANKAPHILLVSKRFNEASQLVVNEIVCRQTVQERAACIEKWAIVADICQCMHNYNGVLQICAAFVNSAVYRLKKTWEKISKQTRQLIDRLQTLVSSDGRFKNMRDALHRCDQPCVPYLGMYLTDLSFIEEGTANITEDGLINFSKMRMLRQVIVEIQHFQQMLYQIEYVPRVSYYLLDTSKLLEEEEIYNFSLEMEPRTPRISVPGQFST